MRRTALQIGTTFKNNARRKTVKTVKTGAFTAEAQSTQRRRGSETEEDEN